jgi:hypothetical protein
MCRVLRIFRMEKDAVSTAVWGLTREPSARGGRTGSAELGEWLRGASREAAQDLQVSVSAAL